MTADEKEIKSPPSLDSAPSKEKQEKEVGQFLPLSDSAEDIEATYGVNEKSLLRKLDRTLLPALTFLYLLSFLDRSNGKST